MADDNSKGWVRVLVAVLQVVVVGVLTVNITITTWACRTIVDHGKSIVSHDEKIKAIEMHMPSELPPQWFVNRVDRLERKIDLLTSNLSRKQSRTPSERTTR